MVSLQRKTLRQDVGVLRLAETTIGTTTLSMGTSAAFSVMDRTWALPDYTGMALYQRAWVRVASVDYRVGSFNLGSGAWYSSQIPRNAIASGADFEIHERIAPFLMDRYIDETILKIPVRREVGIPTVQGAAFYTLDGAASPHTIKSILNVYYFTNPSGSLNRDRRDIPQEAIVVTATGVELRAPYALGASQQLVLDALLTLTMGAGGDTATITFRETEQPDDKYEAILWGAAALCYDYMIPRAQPGEERDALRENRSEAVRQFNRHASKGLPEISKKMTFETPFDAVPPFGLDWP